MSNSSPTVLERIRRAAMTEAHHNARRLGYDPLAAYRRAYCECGEMWWASSEEIAAYYKRQAEHDAWCRRERRREFWRRLTLPIRWPIFRLLERIWPRRAIKVLTDDEIPF